MADERRYIPPLRQGRLPLIDSTLCLSFQDLMEARIVNALVEAGVSLISVRRAIEVARHMFGYDFPLATEDFRTDGRKVFLAIETDSGDHALIDLKQRQFAFDRVISPSFKDLEFDDGVVARWWPSGRTRSVVVDPKRRFGAPVLDDSGVPTDAIAAAFGAEGSVSKVSRQYEISERAVRDALRFEQALAA